MNDEILRLLHLRVKKDHVIYFTDLSFSLRRHEVLGLTHLSAEQRSMLRQYFSGTLPQAEGQLFAFGQPYQLPLPDTLTRIFYCVPPSSTLVEHMSITENLYVLTAPRRERFIIHRRTLDARCQELLDRFGLQLDARTPIEELSAFGRIAVELLKAVVFESRIIFYDRSLDALNEREFSHFQVFLRSLSAFGCSVVLLWGQPERMLSLCGRVIAVKNGVSIKTFSAEAVAGEIRHVISGFSNLPVPDPEHFDPQEGALLRVRGFRLHAADQPLDLTLTRGEIVCLADYTSTNADQILRALYGLLPFSCCHYSVCEKLLPTLRPDLSFADGMLLVRRLESTEELLPNASVQENIALPLLRRSASALGIIRQQFLGMEIASAAQTVGILPEQLSGPLTAELLLRVQLARILLSHRSVLLLENPFNGLDPSDDLLLRRFLRYFAAAGNCVLFSTTHLTSEMCFCTHYYQVEHGELREFHAAEEQTAADQEVSVSCPI